MIANTQYSNPQAGSSPDRGSRSIEPKNPCLHAKADETLKFLSELSHNLGRIDSHLFGEREESKGNQIVPEPGSIEQKVADACHRAACLVGQSSTILNRISDGQ